MARATQNNTLSGNLNPADTTTAVTYKVYDSLGASQNVQITFNKVDATHWGWSVTMPTGIATTGTITFDANGQAVPASATSSITIPGSAGANPVTLALDFTNMTMLSTTGPSDVAMTYQDGVMAGRVSDITIENNSGEIYLQFSNGLRQRLGQLAMARFNNSTGLIRQGHTTFAPSENSGTPNIGAAGTGGRGTYHRRLPGSLECGYGQRIYQHDPGPARFPGSDPGDHHFG